MLQQHIRTALTFTLNKDEHTCVGNQVAIDNPTCSTEAVEVVCNCDKRRTNNGYLKVD